uniref:Dirigent protein n=1 Tax=Leersia perrieri TaxID=77586 RepID=A0A0D9X1Z7_9ORYZ
MAPSLIVVAAAATIFLISLSSASLAYGGGGKGTRKFMRSYDYDSPCKEMRFYLHDILYDSSNSTTNSTSAGVTKPTALATAVSNPGYFFGKMVVFNDPMTEGNSLPESLDETDVRAQGLFFFDEKDDFNVWYAFSIVFNSTTHGHGTLNVVGANPNSDTKDLTVVGGTGDFFMSRGIVTLRGDEVEGFLYFRLLVDIKIYECYSFPPEELTICIRRSTAPSLIVAAAAVLLVSLSSATVTHGSGRGRRFVRSYDYDSPCKQMRFYLHDILYDCSNSTTNSTSAVVASPASLLSAMNNASKFGMVMVFNDPLTEGKSLPQSLEETAVRAQGMYMYDTKKAPGDAWLAFSVVFNSTAHGHGTLSLTGLDLKGFSVVGGTGDFFMARGIATVQLDGGEGTMQGPSMAPSLIVVAAAAVFLVTLSSPTLAHGGGRSRRFVKSHDYDSPCKQMKFYFHDILYDSNNSTTNSTSAVVASPASLLSAMKNPSAFGTAMVFNDPMTEGNSLPPSLDETTGVRAQGMYMYDAKKVPSDMWFAFSVVFNSTVHGHGTLSIMGADIAYQKTKDLPIVGGTGDFFMARGIATLQDDAAEGITYFRLLMDIKLYECYSATINRHANLELLITQHSS